MSVTLRPDPDVLAPCEACNLASVGDCGGLGILLLALFGLLGFSNLHIINGLKNLLSATLTTVAVAFYALGGAVHWPSALLMMVAATAGGYVGACRGRCRYCSSGPASSPSA